MSHVWDTLVKTHCKEIQALSRLSLFTRAYGPGITTRCFRWQQFKRRPDLRNGKWLVLGSRAWVSLSLSLSSSDCVRVSSWRDSIIAIVFQTEIYFSKVDRHDPDLCLSVRKLPLTCKFRRWSRLIGLSRDASFLLGFASRRTDESGCIF